MMMMFDEFRLHLQTNSIDRNDGDVYSVGAGPAHCTGDQARVGVL